MSFDRAVIVPELLESAISETDWVICSSVTSMASGFISISEKDYVSVDRLSDAVDISSLNSEVSACI